MISEMQTKIPGPKSKALHPDRITWSNKLEKTNIWDVDGNRFLDLTSAGGVLPFGYVDEGTVSISAIEADFSAYTPEFFFSESLSELKKIKLGAGITCALGKEEDSDYISMEQLASRTGKDIDLLWVRAEYMDEVSLKNVVSWCQQFDVKWLSDERDMGLFRTGRPFIASLFEPDYILVTVASENFEFTELLYSRSKKPEVEDIKVAANYADSDLTRTINLQSMELSELLKDCIVDKPLGCVGSFHSIDMGSEEEAGRVFEGLMQRGIIVAKMKSKVVLLPSLYLALGEIVFAVNHIRLVVADMNEMSTPWMTDELRD